MTKKLVTVSASYEILTDLDNQNLPIGIELCGRLCYKSEDDITENSAPVFCEKITKHGHNSVLEMRTVTAKVSIKNRSDVDYLINIMPKYLIIDKLNTITLLVTGSIRAFREMVMLYPECDITTSIASLLAADNPCFFEDISSDILLQSIGNIQFLHPFELVMFKADYPELFLRHRHIAVRFIVNRAVTHEIVRHRPCAFLQESQRYCRYAEDKFGNRVTFIEPMFFDKNSREYAQWKKAMLFTEEIYLDLLKTSTPQAARTVLPNSCKTEIIVFCSLVEWNHIFHMRTSKAAEPSMREVMIPLQKEFCKLFSDFSFDRRFPENFV